MDDHGGRRCVGTCRNGQIDAAKQTRRLLDRLRRTETGRNGPVGAAKQTGEGCCGLRGTRTDRSEPVVAAKRTGEGRCGLRGTGGARRGVRGGVCEEGARREGKEGARREQGGKGARRESEEGGARREGRGGRDAHARQRSGAWVGASDLCGFLLQCAVVCLVCRCSMSSVLLCGERDAPATYFVSLSRRFLRDSSSTISPSTSSPSAMMKAAGMAGMLYRPMYGDAFPRASQTFVQGSS